METITSEDTQTIASTGRQFQSNHDLFEGGKLRDVWGWYTYPGYLSDWGKIGHRPIRCSTALGCDLWPQSLTFTCDTQTLIEDSLCTMYLIWCWGDSLDLQWSSYHFFFQVEYQAGSLVHRWENTAKYYWC